MNEVGQRFERGEFYIPEMLIAARTMQSALAILSLLLPWVEYMLRVRL